MVALVRIWLLARLVVQDNAFDLMPLQRLRVANWILRVPFWISSVLSTTLALNMIGTLKWVLKPCLLLQHDLLAFAKTRWRWASLYDPTLLFTLWSFGWHAAEAEDNDDKRI